ncbi:MAG: sensor histidine kinase [Solirubrobacteraceae bacterium]
MTRSLLLLLAAAVAGGGAVVGVYGVRAGVETALLLLAAGAPGLLAAHAAARRRRQLRLSRQFSVAAGAALGSILGATVAAALLMFVSDQDAVMICVITVFAGVVAVRSAQLLGSGVLADVDRVRFGLDAVAEGRRDVRVQTGGTDELARLAAAADAMVARLAAEESQREAAERARRDLVAAASHDLRTPIASLRLMSDAIGDNLVDEHTRQRYHRAMQTNIEALSGLIDDLFELSSLEAGEITWSMKHVQLAELIDEAVAAMKPQALAKRVAVRAELREPIAPARADPDKLQRVLFNLIQNAIRHTPADGSVTVRAAGSPAGVEVEVADTGHGVDPADRARVFEAFYRAGADKSRSTPGAGLGLAISRSIIEAHGGRIWLESQGVGTQVRFSLPLAGTGLEDRQPEVQR